MKKSALLLAGIMAAALALTACGGGSASSGSAASSGSTGALADGVYEGKSEIHRGDEDYGELNDAGYGVVNLTIEEGKITDCVFQTYEENGNLKDEEYGKQNGEVANRDYYNKAQKAVAACDEYAKALVEAGDISGVDTISGATINYDEFVEAVADALSQAAAQ